ncbi:Uncharacterised protein [Candidatus Bilamarchaeum dharawalense]|uniref:Uncharacterized protein n=1 Tax=Candidatus Bilamarchaeum dharawalense TaxID=2885759 RepID=A0A5E4LV77_9ARCH|nr:Uncharacterised protein [Candidatus Bilamarchaeum dharawalense]
MAKASTYPREFDDSAKSAYRMKMAGLATALPEGIMKRMRAGESLSMAGTFKTQRMLDREATAAKDFQLALRELGLEVFADEKFNVMLREVFINGGVFFDAPGEVIMTGPLVAKGRIGTLEIASAALAKHENGCCCYAPKRHVGNGTYLPPNIVLDMTDILDTAIYRINLFRFGEYEPISSFAMSSREVRGPVPSPTELRRRLDILTSDHPSRQELEQLMRIWNLDSAQASNAIFGLRNMGRSIGTLQQEDDVAHTIEYCNALGRMFALYNVIQHLELRRRFGPNPDYDTVTTELMAKRAALSTISWLADLGYGDTTLRLGEIYFAAASGQFDPDSVSVFSQFGMGPIMSSVVVAAESNYDAIHQFANADPQKIAAAARNALDVIFRQLTGKTFVKAHPGVEGIVEEVRQFVPLPPDKLPLVAEMWKRKDEYMFTRYLD